MPSLFKTICAVLCLVFGLCFAAPIAHADTVFTVTGSFDNGAILSGTATINTSTGIVTAFDLSTTGAFVSGPYTTVDPGQGPFFNQYFVSSTLSIFGIDLLFPPPGSLVGYAGGSLCSDLVPCTFISFLAGPSPLATFNLTSGSLTPQAATPEPSSLFLMLAGAGLVSAMRKRRIAGWQQAA